MDQQNLSGKDMNEIHLDEMPEDSWRLYHKEDLELDKFLTDLVKIDLGSKLSEAEQKSSWMVGGQVAIQRYNLDKIFATNLSKEEKIKQIISCFHYDNLKIMKLIKYLTDNHYFTKLEDWYRDPRLHKNENGLLGKPIEGFITEYKPIDETQLGA